MADINAQSAWAKKPGMSSYTLENDRYSRHAYRSHRMGIYSNKYRTWTDNVCYWAPYSTNNVLFHSRRVLSHSECEEKYALRLLVFALISMLLSTTS